MILVLKFQRAGVLIYTHHNRVAGVAALAIGQSGHTRVNIRGHAATLRRVTEVKPTKQSYDVPGGRV